MAKPIIVFLFLVTMIMNTNSQVTKTYVELDSIKSMCTMIYQQALEDNFKPDLLIGICRGGLIPTGLLAGEALFNNRNILTVDVASYDEHDQQTELQVLFPVHLSDYKNCRSVLIIDDLVDSGETVDFVINMIKKEIPDATIKVAALFYKTKSKIVPDYYAQETSDWIVFPWEV